MDKNLLTLSKLPWVSPKVTKIMLNETEGSPFSGAESNSGILSEEHAGSTAS